LGFRIHMTRVQAGAVCHFVSADQPVVMAFLRDVCRPIEMPGFFYKFQNGIPLDETAVIRYWPDSAAQIVR
jgi:hypothetical protein